MLDGLILGLVIGLLTRGRIRNLEYHEIRWGWLFVLLLSVQMVAPKIAVGVSGVVLLWLFWVVPVVGCLVIAVLNIRQPGFPLILLGLLSNLLVVSLNSGMPVLVPNALMVGGSSEQVLVSVGTSWLHRVLEVGTRLPWLGDVIPIPGPSWHRGLVSYGDILLSAGVGLYVLWLMHSGDSETAQV